MRYLSVCSGIEAATVAWHDMGWQPAAFSEIEPFPSAVLAHHYPTVPNVGDMTKYKEWDIGAIDLLVGGTPCQSFSVAGLRKGLADPRGNLALVYLGIADLFKPKWIVWENVPGVLSSGGGRDFGSFLGALAQLGYGFAYRVLDAQWFGVAQRRRRVFVVGYLGDWRPAAAVLFERQSLSGHPKPSREAGQKVAPTVVQGPPYSRTGNERVECEAIVAQPIPYDLHQVTAPVNRQAREPGDPCHTLAKQNAHNAGIVHGVAQPIGGVDYENNAHLMNQPTGPLLKGSPTGGGRPLPALVYPMAVRRLTPVECERLQGFSDNYTEIPWRGKAETPDGPRYKALGNSMAVPVMRWIGQRINGK
jgi:DNA (cytosine-5)-methyltransferase 1